jgi:hypothetical protein
LEAIDNQIILLCEANSSSEAYLDVVDMGQNGGGDDNEKLPHHQVWLVRQKVLILTCALLKAKEKMEKLHNWDTCCDEAKDDALKIGFKAATCSRTIRNWYQEFRVIRKIKVQVLSGRHNLPPFFQQNKDVAISIQHYGRENLQELSVELMADDINNTILPKLCHEATGATPTDDSYQSDVKLLLKRYGLSSVCLGTVCSCIKNWALSMSREERLIMWMAIKCQQQLSIGRNLLSVT